MENRNVFLFAGLVLVGMILWQQWKLDNAPPEPVGAETASGVSSDGPTPPRPQPGAGDSVPPSPPVRNVTTPEVPAVETDPESLIRVRTDVMELLIDPAGGDVRRVALTKYMAESDSEEPFLLGGAVSEGRMLVQGGVVGLSPESPSFTHDKGGYTAVDGDYQLRDGEDEISVRLRGEMEEGVTVEKIFTLRRDSYVVDTLYRVDNEGGQQSWSGRAYAQLRRVETKSGWINPSYIGAAVSSPEDHYEKKAFSDIRKNRLSEEINGGWIGWLQHYFVSAVLPMTNGADTAESNHYYGFHTRDNHYIIGSWTAPVTAPAGGHALIGHRLYLGPKEQKRLKAAAPRLELAVDYGWLFFLSNILFSALVWINAFIGNWGVSIIVLTFIVKLIFFPLSSASYRSMAKMRELQPRILKLRERYGDDKQSMQREMMRLYGEEKVNPLGGCLPILVQIPVFIALYWVLLESVELRHAEFALWLTDLSSPDPFFILPVLMGVSMYAQQRLGPQSPDPTQRKIFAIMPIPFALFTMLFPAGLVLYWVASNILSIMQQAFIIKRFETGRQRAG